MHKNQVILNVRMEAVAGRERELEGHLEALVEPTRAETGCIAYDLHRNRRNAGCFHVLRDVCEPGGPGRPPCYAHFQAFAKYREKDDPVAATDVTKWLKLR